MRNRIIKLFVVVIALLCSLSQHALGQRRDGFVDLYAVKKHILLPNEYDVFKCKQISDYLVSLYLCETKNDCLINLSTGYEFSYYAIGKIDFNPIGYFYMVKRMDTRLIFILHHTQKKTIE